MYHWNKKDAQTKTEKKKTTKDCWFSVHNAIVYKNPNDGEQQHQ